jgi:hypothetical protein
MLVYLVFICLATLAIAGPAPPDIVSSAMCECACQASTNASRTVDYFPVSAGAECTTASCEATFPVACEVTDSEAQIEVTFYNCGCACCTENTCPALRYYGHTAPSSAACSESACAATTLGCPDTGGHNSQAQVTAYWHGEDLPTLAVDELALDSDCQCECAATSSAELRRYPLRHGTGQQCTPELCSSSFRNCPDQGSHNDGAIVIATPYDCMCACCETAASCSTPQRLPWLSGSAAACTAQGCSDEHNSCLSPTDAPDAVSAAYTGRPSQPSANVGDGGSGGGSDGDDDDDDGDEDNGDEELSATGVSAISTVLPECMRAAPMRAPARAPTRRVDARVESRQLICRVSACVRVPVARRANRSSRRCAAAVIALAVLFPLLFAVLVVGICVLTYSYSRGYRFVKMSDSKAIEGFSSPLSQPTSSAIERARAASEGRAAASSIARPHNDALPPAAETRIPIDHDTDLTAQPPVTVEMSQAAETPRGPPSTVAAPATYGAPYPLGGE